MLRTLGIVEACYDTDRTRAHACRKLGGKPVLEWVARRATDCQQLDGVIVVTNSDLENQFVHRVVPADIPVYRSQFSDPLSGIAAALEEYPAEAVVRICSGWPFLDVTLVDQLVRTAHADDECDYACYCLRDGRPTVLCAVGVYVEWFRAEALREAARCARSPSDRQHVTSYLYRHPRQYHIRLIPAPEQIDRDDLRLAVDMEEDWEHAITIFEALGPDLDWHRIADLLDHHPALRQRMEALNRVHAHG